MHDTHDEIFEVVDKHAEKILKTKKLLGIKTNLEERGDPFSLYASYLNVVKPIELEEKDDILALEN